MKIESITTIKEYHIPAIEEELVEYCKKHNIDALVHNYPALRCNDQIASNRLFQHIADSLNLNMKQGFFNGIEVIIKCEEIETFDLN
jgi:diketogulonate reductase-like aldo/keto reductase